MKQITHKNEWIYPFSIVNNLITYKTKTYIYIIYFINVNYLRFEKKNSYFTG